MLAAVWPRSETTLRSHWTNVIGVSQCQDHFDCGYRGQPVSMRMSLGARGIVRRAASFEMFDATCCRHLAFEFDS